LFEQGFTGGFRARYTVKEAGILGGLENAACLPSGNTEQLSADFRRDVKIRLPAGDRSVNILPYYHRQIRPAFTVVKRPFPAPRQSPLRGPVSRPLSQLLVCLFFF
jgi:hypothetical protein